MVNSRTRRIIEPVQNSNEYVMPTSTGKNVEQIIDDCLSGIESSNCEQGKDHYCKYLIGTYKIVCPYMIKEQVEVSTKMGNYESIRMYNKCTRNNNQDDTK